jgi:hypothetical protein
LRERSHSRRGATRLDIAAVLTVLAAVMAFVAYSALDYFAGETRAHAAESTGFLENPPEASGVDY